MSETFAEYAARISSLMAGRDPLTVLSGTSAQLAALVTGKSAEAMTAKPAPGKWSAAEIIIHLSEVELVIGYRVRLMLGANGTPIQGFDQDAWAVRYAQQAWEPAMEMFRAVRAQNLALLKSLTPEQWQHYGIHSERGRETVERTVTLYAGHDLNHLAQLQGML